MSATKKLVIIPDLHVPYHSVTAWAVLMKTVRSFKPDIIIQLGDLIDAYAVSAHSKDPGRKADFEWEIAQANAALDELDSAAGRKCQKFITLGNHEYRVDRYLQDNAPQLNSFVSTEKLLGFADRGWDVTPYKKCLRIGKVAYTHDLGVAGERALKAANETIQGNVVIGHTHRAQAAYYGTHNGTSHVARSFGWMGDVSGVNYMHRDSALRSWQLGFGAGRMDASGNTFFVDCPVVKPGKTVLEGKTYTAK